MFCPTAIAAAPVAATAPVTTAFVATEVAIDAVSDAATPPPAIAKAAPPAPPVPTVTTTAAVTTTTAKATTLSLLALACPKMIQTQWGHSYSPDY